MTLDRARLGADFLSCHPEPAERMRLLLPLLLLLPDAVQIALEHRDLLPDAGQLPHAHDHLTFPFKFNHLLS